MSRHRAGWRREESGEEDEEAKGIVGPLSCWLGVVSKDGE